jgi:hypothetical protein
MRMKITIPRAGKALVRLFAPHEEIEEEAGSFQVGPDYAVHSRPSVVRRNLGPNTIY